MIANLKRLNVQLSDLDWIVVAVILQRPVVIENTFSKQTNKF